MEENRINIGQLTTKIKDILKTSHKDYFVVAIDGDSAAGKTTYAKELTKELDANLVHIDDFYLPFKDRKECSSCHIDYQRLLETVLIPFKSAKNFNYYKYDPHIDQIIQHYEVVNQKILILEGSYSFHPQLRSMINLSIMLSIDEDEQRNRVINRSSKEMFENFKRIWIPKEKNYQQETQLERSVDIHIHV